jgi:hypothetical protein
MSARARCADRRAASVKARRPNPVLALVTVAFAALAHAPGAVAQLPALEQVEAIVADATPVPVPAQASQLADQAASVAQAAAADAAAIQEQPTNVSVPAVAASPGAEAAVEQENDAAAVADAKNANAAVQEVDQSQGDDGGAAPSGGGQAQAGAQSAQTTQVAAAQAVAVQTHPINIAIPIIVNSPNTQSVIVQANSVAAAAGAANASSTTQTANQAQVGPGFEGGRTAPDPGVPALPGSHTTEPAGGGSLSGVGQEALAGLAAQPGSAWIWIWNWNWTWTVPDVSVPGLSGGIVSPAVIDIAPSLSDLVSAVDATVLQELAGLVGAPPNASGQDAAKRRSDPGARERAGTGRPVGAPWGGEGTRPGASTLPSSFVQSPADDGNAQDRRVQTADPSLPLPLPKHSAPAGSGGASVSPFGFVLGALLLLVFQLAAAAFALSRRFDLASAAWRRQAYLSPLERPG